MNGRENGDHDFLRSLGIAGAGLDERAGEGEYVEAGRKHLAKVIHEYRQGFTDSEGLRYRPVTPVLFTNEPGKRLVHPEADRIPSVGDVIALRQSGSDRHRILGRVVRISAAGGLDVEDVTGERGELLHVAPDDLHSEAFRYDGVVSDRDLAGVLDRVHPGRRA